MGLITQYSDANLVIEEGLTVTYSRRRVSGSWGWTAANMSGSYSAMIEHHRYATKSFRYVGMTYDAAKTCRDAMVKLFTRTIRESVWNDSATNGEWTVTTAGSQLCATVTITHDDACMYSVHVRVNEDDSRYRKVGDDLSDVLLFANEQLRTYGSDAHGTAAETESTTEA